MKFIDGFVYLEYIPTMKERVKIADRDFPVKESKCTCGVKFTGGICSDWCDTNNPEPDTEEIPF